MKRDTWLCYGMLILCSEGYRTDMNLQAGWIRLAGLHPRWEPRSKSPGGASSSDHGGLAPSSFESFGSGGSLKHFVRVSPLRDFESWKTPVMELLHVFSKPQLRLLLRYVTGVQRAARHLFRIACEQLNPVMAARQKIQQQDSYDSFPALIH